LLKLHLIFGCELATVLQLKLGPKGQGFTLVQAHRRRTGTLTLEGDTPNLFVTA
jgi:hypothetical protein